MANGNSVNHWHSYGNWSVAVSGKTATVTLTVGMASESWGFSISSGITATATVDGTSGSASGGFGSGTGQSVARSLKTVSKSFTRGHSAQGKSVSWRVVNSSGYMNGTSSGSGTATIPALGSHTVTFNANGGSGGPASAVKWEYEDLAIPSAVPTRTNYRFLGWSTSPTGTAAYEAGKTYSGMPDSNYTLYAVWKLMYVPPSFTGALALRTGDATATVENPTGNYAYASFTWKVDTTVYSSNALKSITCVYYKDGSTTATAVSLTGTTSGTSGTVNAHFAADSGSAYRLVCTATDTQGGSTSVERSVAAANFPLEIASRGKGIGLLHSAPEEGISLGGVTLTGANGVSGSYPMSTLKGVLDNARYVKHGSWYVARVAGLTLAATTITGTATGFTNTGTSTNLYKNLGTTRFPVTFSDYPVLIVSPSDGTVLKADATGVSRTGFQTRIMFDGTSTWMGSSVPYKVGVMAVGIA